MLCTVCAGLVAQVPAPGSSTGDANYNMNWIMVKKFDDSGKVISDAKQFYDNMGRSLQSQAKVKYRKNTDTVYTHVFASQTLRDAMGKEAVTTMAAPTNNSEFVYKADFTRNSSGGAYDYRNFDLYNATGTETDKTNNPDAVGGQNVPGTLGWYYSSNNTWEPYTPTTSYPYSRQILYKDGTGHIKKSAGAGESFKAGSGREVKSYETTVVNELTHYFQVRNKFFTTVGATPSNLQYRAVQNISADVNGRMAVIIQDDKGKVLMTARPGSELSVTNTVIIDAGNVFYFRTFASGAITISSAANLFYNMDTEQPVSIGTGGTVAAGYYKLVNTGTTNITATYTNAYREVNYSFYNQLGQLIASIPPEGVKKLYGSGLNNYATKNDVPFITLYEYNMQGRLVKNISTEEGTTEMVYRKDGNIRFSQNDEQRPTGRYSYTNYDKWGRPVETGEYWPDASGMAFNSDLSAAGNPLRGILENTGSTGGLTTGTKTDVQMTLYDTADNSHNISGYTQNVIYLGGQVSATKKYSSILNNSPVNTNMVSSTWYNYDDAGKVLWMIQYIKDLGYKTSDFTYDGLNRLVKKVYQKNVTAETFVHYYDYDPATQGLWKIYTNTTDNVATRQLQATYIYYLHGPLKRIELAGNLQGIDYTYTLQGILKAVNNSDKTKDPASDGANGFSPDAFGMVLDYYPGDYVNSRTSGIQPIKGVNSSAIGTDSYAGNIKAMTWFSRKPASVTGSSPGIEDPVTYVFQYDDKYQFTESTWGTGINFSSSPATFTTTPFNKETIKHPTTGVPAYDAHGNILYLQRTNTAGTLTDGFTYNYLNTTTGTGSPTNYNTNKLQSVVNNATGTAQTYASYIYDKLGRLTAENTGNTATQKYIKYDVTGKVIMVARDTGFNQKLVEYVYNERGQRVIKKTYNTAYQLAQITYYVGSVIYTQAVNSGTPGAVTVQEYEIQGSGGRLGVYYRQSDIYAYQLNDHLGNVRAVVARNGSTAEVRMYTDYYPYGMVIRQGGTNDYRYEYQGQHSEKDKETNWNAFELRMYDSRIARWTTTDPAGVHFSPYLAMANNPVNAVDKDGAAPLDWYLNNETNELEFLEGVTGEQEGYTWVASENATVNEVQTALDNLVPGNTFDVLKNLKYYYNELSLANDIANTGADFAEFGMGLAQVGIDDYIGSLRIGLGAPKSLLVYKGIGGFTKMPGIIGVVTMFTSAYFDYNAATLPKNDPNRISWTRFTWRTAGNVASFGVPIYLGMVYGSSFGPWGTVIGGGIGASFWAAEQSYDATIWYRDELSKGAVNFQNNGAQWLFNYGH
jgi:RHS repeat-associated protein